MKQHVAYDWFQVAQQEQPSRWPQTPRPRVAGETRVPVRGDPPTVSGRLETIRGAAVWEFFEKGGWKVMSPDLQTFLSEQYHNSVDETYMILNDDKTKMYCWDFVKLEQTRWHHIGADEWENVKTRSIRRVQILAAPKNVVG